MGIGWLLAAVHLLGLGIGLGAVYVRARALRGELDRGGLRRALQADIWWAVAAAVGAEAARFATDSRRES